jgi:F-type H+-transporting ATPase subunit a
MATSPLEQFEIHPLAAFTAGGHNLAFTNSSMFMMIAVGAISLFLLAGMSRASVVPGRWQSMAELSYEFVANMVRDNVGSAGRPYFPFIFTLFMFILFLNLLGLVPGAFTVTSHIIITFAMAATVFVGVTLLGMFKHGIKFLGRFAPSGVPWPILILLVPIELISYCVRPFSLSLRLFANMLAGHTMLKIFGGFVVMMGVFGAVPLLVIVGLTALEVFVAMVQAYVFTILTCIYLNDVIHIHH